MSFQTTIIAGYVGGEVTVAQVGESKVANFSVAVNERFGQTERTSWYKIAAWDGLADVALEHVTKGRMILIEGRVSGNPWVDRNGELQFTLSLNAQKLQLLGSKPEPAV
jgi:single-strand DNA-binding protein